MRPTMVDVWFTASFLTDGELSGTRTLPYPTTVWDFFNRVLSSENPDDFVIRVNGLRVASDQILVSGDRVTFLETVKSLISGIAEIQGAFRIFFATVSGNSNFYRTLCLKSGTKVRDVLRRQLGTAFGERSVYLNNLLADPDELLIDGDCLVQIIRS
mgnify:CR=1 FL=1